MPLDLKDRLTNSFQKLKDSTTLDERAASLLKPISNTFKPVNMGAYKSNLSIGLGQGLRNSSNFLGNVQSGIENTPILGDIAQIPKYRGIRAGKSIISGLESANQGGKFNAGVGGLQIGYGLAQLNPFSPIASAALSLKEPLAAGLVKSVRTRTNPLTNVRQTLQDPYAGVGTTGLGLKGNVGLAADFLLDPDISGALIKRGGNKAIAKGMDQYYQATGKKWHPEDIITLHNLEKRFNGLKVAKGGKIYDNITKIEYDKLRDDIYNLAQGYLRNDEIDAIMQRGGNDKEIFGDLFKALKDKSWENPNMIKMGLAGDAQPTKGDMELLNEANKYTDSNEFFLRSKRGRELLREQGIKSQEAIKNWFDSNAKPAEKVLDTLNPTGTVLTDYDPKSRMTMRLGENMTTLDKTMGVSPTKKITVYRGVPENVNKINPGDYVTTDINSAKSWGNKVISQEVNAKDVLDDATESLGGDYIYRPSLPQPTKGDMTLNDLQKSGLVSGFAGSPPKGTKERGFVKTVRNAESTAKPVSEQVKGYYKPITNKDTLNQAQSYIDTLGWDKSKQKVLSEELTAENNAIGLELMRRAQDEGRYDEAIEVAEALSKKGTEAGQAVQAFAIWGRMTPEGMTRYAVKQIEKAKADMGAVTKLVRDLTGKKMGDIKLTMEDSKKISSLMKKANNAKSEADRMKYTKQALEVINDRIPYGVSDLVDEMRYNNMLSNPKSHLRNAYQNALNTLVTKPATLVLEGKPIGAAKYYSGVLTGLPEATNKALKTIAGEVEIKKPDLQEVRTGKLPTIWQTPTRALEAGDQFFSALIKNGMQAAGASAEDAAKAAEYTLLRTDVGAKGQGHLLSAMDTVSNWLYKAPKPVRWFVPFVRTPMNAAKQWIEFSPAGLATVPGSANQREQLAKTMVGSMAMFVGARMAAEDRVTWSAPTDPKEKQLFYASGRKPFSIRMGDKWVPLFYAGPFAATMALPAAVKHYQDENRTALTDSQLDKITDVSADMLKFVMGQTPLTGLNTFVKLAEGDIDYSVPKNLGFTASQLIPGTGLLNYIADVLDPIYRKPSGFAESIKSGIPGMTQDLQAYTEPTGEPSTRLPQNYVMPYDLGQANQSYEMPYQQRKQELQQNAVINQFKKQVSDQVDLGTSPASGFQPTDKLGASLATLKESEEQKERFSRSREFMQFYNQNPQAVVQSIQQLGIDPNDAVFDYVANQSVDARTPFVASMIEGIQDRNQMLGVLAGMRKEVNGNKLLSDGVIDNLHDEGIIGPNEKRMLKNLEFDKDGEIKKSSGKGKKIKVPSLISTSQLLTAFNNYMKAKTTMPKSSSSRNLSDLYAKRRQRIQNIF